MSYIKIFHPDGLIYFDQIRVADLVLLRTDEANKYLLTIDIGTFEGYYSADEILALEKQLGVRINIPQEMEFAHAVYEDYVILENPNDLDGLEIIKDDNHEKHLYFGWHILLRNNRLTFQKNGSTVRLHWTALGNDTSRYQETPDEHAVEVMCDLNCYVMTIDEWKDFAKIGTAKRDRYQQLRLYEVTEATHPHLSEFERAQKAWGLASQT